MTDMKKGRSADRKGFVLITALLFSAVLLIITLAYVFRVTTEYGLESKIYNSTSALNLAEAGVEMALWELTYNNSAFSGWNRVADGLGNTTITTSIDNFQSYGGKNMGDCNVVVWIASNGMNATATCTAYVPDRASPDETRTVKVTYVRNNFTLGVLGLTGITMSGQARTDSYDSSIGPYNPNPADPGYNRSQDGSIASNGAINLSGQAYVNGDANPGPDYPFSGTPPVSGSYGTLSAEIEVAPIPSSTIDAAELSNDNGNIIEADGDPFIVTGGALSVSASQSIVLQGGTYYFTSINSSGTINVAAPSTIYVDGGNVSIAGPGIINSGQPRDLLLYSTGSSINMSGQASFSGAIYAPSSTVTLTGQENFYGSIICGSNVDSGQAAIHYDKDLENVAPVFANGVTSWQEL